MRFRDHLPKLSKMLYGGMFRKANILSKNVHCTIGKSYCDQCPLYDDWKGMYRPDKRCKLYIVQGMFKSCFPAFFELSDDTLRDIRESGIIEKIDGNVEEELMKNFPEYFV